MDLKSCQSHLFSNEMSIYEINNYYLQNYKQINDVKYLVKALNPHLINDIKLLTYEYKNDKKRSQIHGIPLLVSDLISVKGFKTDLGNDNITGDISNKSSFVIKKLKQSGMIILGKTNSQEYNQYFNFSSSYLEPISDNNVKSCVALSIINDLSPVGIDVEVNGNSLNLYDTNLISLKLSTNFFKDCDYMKLEDSTSLSIIGKNSYDIAYLINALKDYDYMSDYFDTLRKIKIGALYNNCNINDARVISLKLVEVENDEVLSSNLEKIGITSSDEKTYKSKSYNLDSIFDLKKVDIILTNKYEDFMSHMYNPCISFQRGEERLYAISKTNDESSLLSFVSRF